jgi:AraC family transcriptional regulator of adaptative response / methylphosphotriester-DNA alkyltransferase methyltransferase
MVPPVTVLVFSDTLFMKGNMKFTVIQPRSFDMRRRVMRRVVPPYHLYRSQNYPERGVIHVLSGVAYLKARGREQLLEPGSTVLLFPHLRFRLYAKSEGYRALGIYNPHCALEVSSDTPVVLPVDERLHGFAEELMATMRKPGRFQRDLLHTGADYFAALAFKKVETRLEAQAHTHEYWVDFAKNLIDTHLEEHITLKELFEPIPFSYEHFIRVFKSVHGITPREYEVQERLARSKDLLANSHLSVTEVAHELGYSSSQHFSADFKKRTGVTPSSYKAEVAAD